MHSSLILIFINVLCISAKNILVIHHAVSGSHVKPLRTLSMELASRHQVTVLFWDDKINENLPYHPNITDRLQYINNSNGYLEYVTPRERGRYSLPSDALWNDGLSLFQVLDVEAFKLVSTVCGDLLGNKNLFRQLKTERFDLAIVDLVANECGLAYAYLLGLDVVGYMPFSFINGESQLTPAHTTPALLPQIYSTYSNSMSFPERLWNLFYAVGSTLVMKIQCYVVDQQIQKYFPGTPPASTLLANLSGVIINSSPVLDYPQLLPPTYIQAGGFHIRPPKALPQEIQDFIGDSEVIIFSLGANFDPKKQPLKVIQKYFHVFRNLKQKVIMRMREVSIDVPNNIMIQRFLPQNDLLALNNTVLFITHCGMHGTLEALHYAVPMVAMPIFFDQLSIATRMERRGLGLTISRHSSAQELYQAITTILSDSRYQKRMTELSSLFQSFPGSPLLRVTKMIEDVFLKHESHHFKIPLHEVNFVQYYCVDILSAYILLIIIILWVLLAMLRAIHRQFLNQCFRIKYKKT